MDRRQRNFLIFVAALVALFALVMIILSSTRRQAIPVPLTPVVPATSTPPTNVTPPVVTATAPTPAPSTPTSPAATPQVSPTPRAPMSFFVSPDGIQSNDGSKDHPWPLQYVLSQQAPVLGGDTIWLRGGNYIGSFTCSLNGAEGKPINIRAYPGERVTLENNDRVLDIASASYVNFWDIEITATQNNRDPKNPNNTAYGVRINQGKPSHDIKFINMIVHDMPTQGFAWWQANSNSLIYGTLVYFNGVTQLDHGIYVHNGDGKKSLIDNIIFDNASHGIHAYGEKDYQPLNNIDIEGNTLFDNGSIGYSTSTGTWGVFKRNILVGGDALVAQNPVIINNYTYYPNSSGVSLNLGYRAGSSNAVVEDNYFAGGGIEMGSNNNDVTMMKNTIMGLSLGSLPNLLLSQNTLSLKADDTRIFVRPNQYEPGRANITVYNWPKNPTVTVNADQLSGVQIHPGDHYELHNAQDYFNDVITGTYNGQSIDLPMTGHSVAQPLGLSFKPASTFPEFGSFVLIVQTQANQLP